MISELVQWLACWTVNREVGSSHLAWAEICVQISVPPSPLSKLIYDVYVNPAGWVGK